MAAEVAANIVVFGNRESSGLIPELSEEQYQSQLRSQGKQSSIQRLHFNSSSNMNIGSGRTIVEQRASTIVDNGRQHRIKRSPYRLEIGKSVAANAVLL